MVLQYPSTVEKYRASRPRPLDEEKLDRAQMEDRGLRCGLPHAHRNCVRVRRYAAGVEGPHTIEVIPATDAMGKGLDVRSDGPD